MRKFASFTTITLGLVMLSSVVLDTLSASRALALSGSSFNAGHIIDDSVFYNSGAMSATDIQSFLNAKVPTCDTNGATSITYYYKSSTSEVHTSSFSGGVKTTTSRAAYGQRYATFWNSHTTDSLGNKRASSYVQNQSVAPYTCLKSYKMNTPAKNAESGICGNLPAYTNRTAAQIIKDVSVACGINPQVMIILLQKEQGLVTDVWPWDNQYQIATGYGCPDPPPGQPLNCNSTYYGLFNQLYNAARQFKRYRADPTNWNYVAGRSNKIYYNPNSSCGYSSVTIQNQATAGLYNYTPYQPNKAALDNLYGTGNSCSAYGNRNFWRYFNDWFGNPTSKSVYSWAYVSQGLYSDSARTNANAISNNTQLNPGQTVYFRLTAKNTGNRVWYPPMVKLGTSNPNNRTSQVQNSSWPGSDRAALLKESSVSPGSTGTFEGSFTVPANYTGYKEYFNLVADGVAWFNDLGAYFVLNMPNFSAQATSVEAYANSARTNKLNPNSISTYTGLKLYMRVKIKNTGNQDLPGNITKLATNNPNDRPSVFSDSTWIGSNNNRAALLTNATLAPSAIGTFDFTMTAPSTSGSFTESFGIVMEGARWLNTTGISYVIDVRARPSEKLTSGQRLNPDQELLSSDGRFRLRFQSDGNFVLYSPNGYTWQSGTAGKKGAYVVMQSDGNLVMYTSAGKAIWHTKTGGKGTSHLIMQSDGNAVIYGTSSYTWQSHTSGKL